MYEVVGHTDLVKRLFYTSMLFKREDVVFYLAPLKSEMMDKKVVMHRLILPGIKSEGMKTEQADKVQSMKLGM